MLRRPDADPRAVLGITITREKAAPAKPASNSERVRADAPAGERPMTQKELIEHFGSNVLPGAEAGKSY